MRWGSAVSTEASLEAAVDEVARAVRPQLGGERPDLAVVFASEHHRPAYDRIPALVGASLAPGVLVGCSAGGVIGGGREIEGRPGLSLTAARLPGVTLTPLHLDGDQLPVAAAPPAAWTTLLQAQPGARPHFLLLPDPFTFEAERLVVGLDRAFPTSTTVGGLASGAQAPGDNALFLGTETHRSGVVVVALAGDIAVDTIVAQGCRPIGDPLFVTRCERNIILELDGRRPFEVLQGLVTRADERDRALFRHSLFLGIVMKEQAEYRQGDFLIRNLAGIDPASGAIAVGALPELGAVVQFHLRDADTSREDLEALLRRYAAERGASGPAGALLFSCLGRGTNLYGRPDHDTDAVRRHLGDIPLGGFFCNGEIGPVRGATFLHGYTSAFGLFRSRG
jgi:small ligand-binding sensory domain FIST